MSVILVNPPSLYHMPRIGEYGRLSYFELSRRQLGPDGYWSIPGEHLGLRSVEASCAALGIPVEVVNGQVRFDRSTDQTWQGILAAAGRQGPPAIVGFSGPCQVFEENLELAALVKATWPECLTVLGHDFATLNHRRVLEQHPVFDLVCLGEGEQSFPALARAVLDGRGPHDIPGVVARGGRTTAAAVLNLDDLPWPSRGDLGAVLGAGLSPAVFTSRGCPYQCTYCTTGETASRLAGADRHRLKSLDNVYAEIEDLVRRHGVHRLTITDDLFLTKSPASRERAAQFARRLIAAGLDLEFMIDCRVDSIDADVFRLLRQAGLTRVFVGVETANPEQLEFYNKRYTRSQDRRSYIHSQLNLARDMGIDVIPGIITYHAESAIPELRDTLALIDGCDLESTYLFLDRLIAYPGTPVYRRYRERGLLVEEWPVPRWEIADPQIAAIEQAMLRAESEGLTFRQMRDLFASLVGHDSAAVATP